MFLYQLQHPHCHPRVLSGIQVRIQQLTKNYLIKRKSVPLNVGATIQQNGQ